MNHYHNDNCDSEYNMSKNKYLKGIAYTADASTFIKGKKIIPVETYRRYNIVFDVIIFGVIIIGVFLGIIIAIAYFSSSVPKPQIEPILRATDDSVKPTERPSSYVLPPPCALTDVYCANEPKIIYAKVTGYNSVEAQTDSDSCLGAGGYVCGRRDVVACPRAIDLGTKIKIGPKTYTCLDRLARKYDNRFDIFFDKDIEAAKAWGIQTKEVTILE